MATVNQLDLDLILHKHRKLLLIAAVIGLLFLIFSSSSVFRDDALMEITTETTDSEESERILSPTKHPMDSVIPSISLSIKRSHIDIENEQLRSIRNAQCQHSLSEGHDHCICDYVNLKGMPKSGTSWMIASLKQIQSYFCDQRGLRELLHLQICIKWHVGAYHRHPLVLPKQNDNPRLMVHFDNNQSAFLEELKRTRFCSVTAFRDPRDRSVSWAYWNSKNMKQDARLFERINHHTVQFYANGIKQFNEYWNVFRNAEMDDPTRFYNYFYDDMNIDTFEGMQKMVEFIGFYHINGFNVSDEDIINILNLTSSGALIAEGSNILYRKGKVCGFHQELSAQNVDKIQKMTIELLDPMLVEKFNQSCSV